MSADTPPRPPSNRGGTRPSLMGIPSLSSRRLRSNSGTDQQSFTDLAGLTQAEVNSIAPPSPVYKIVLTGGPCGGKTTSLARVSRLCICYVLFLLHICLRVAINIMFHSLYKLNSCHHT